MKSFRFLPSAILIFGLLIADSAVPQSLDLTPQQQAMLNQLPPAEREKALAALRQMQQKNSSDSQLSNTNEALSKATPEDKTVPPGTSGAPAEPKAQAGSRLIVSFELKPDLPRETNENYQQDTALKQITGSQFFELDDNAKLTLPGISTIDLDGLTADQIQQRLGAEPALGVFDISVSLLNEAEAAADALEPFGYSVFEPRENGLEAVTTGPVPSDYVLGPGDTVRVQLFGNVNGIYEYEVSRDGVLNLPEIGPITVAGLPFSEFRKSLNERVQKMLIGTQVSVTMGQLRTIRVFVLGDANQPGSYVVSSLATISSALYVSGGVSPVGSLRKIELKRDGKLVTHLDLYDLLLNGDTSDDARLQPGDVIFVPPVGPQVTVDGAVKRPAIYETRGQASVADIVRLAGGLTADAFPDGARIERIDENSQRIVVSVDANPRAAAKLAARPGDVLTIPRVLPDLHDTVQLEGHVQRPGPYQWHKGMRLTDLIGSLRALKPEADTGYLLIRREDPRDLHVYVKSVNYQAALSNRSSDDNLRLQPRDTVYVFSREYGRQRVIEPILHDLAEQARIGEPYEEVSISGMVRAPGIYPLEPGMRVSDLIRAGGDLSEEAYALKAELARYKVIDGEYRSTEVISIDLGAIRAGNAAADLELSEHDNVRISTVPKWDTLWSVRLEGEVKFPGDYRIRRGETLGQVLERAGGLTDSAFPDGAIFLREALREREQSQIEALANRMEEDLASMSLENLDTTGSKAFDTGKVLLSQLRDTKAVGRLVIDLQSIASERETAVVKAKDVELRDGDRLLVPKKAQEVTVIGEVQQSTSHLYQPGLTRDDYIGLSGGLTRRADKKLIYVVRASGAVVANQSSRWFQHRGQMDIRAGDTIVVPLQTDRIRPLTLWANVTQILYQAAIALAAVKSFAN